MASSRCELRGKFLGKAFIETVQGSPDFQKFCGMIHQRDSIVVSVGSDIFMLSRAGLAPVHLTPANEAEWLSKMGRVT